MPKRAEQTLTPRLRFPEFIGQTLREVQLKDVTAESTTRNGDKLPITSVMGVRKAEGIVPMEERIIASDIARYKIVQKEWFAYNPMRLNIGSIAQWKGENDILVSPDYIVFKCLTDADSGIDPSYLNHFRQSAAWENVVTEGGDGSVRVRIYYKDLARLYLALPPFIEQQKLADCLTSLDEVIAAQGQKVAALKAHKRGLMQQLFPREGETRPRLRFPEFRNAPEWKEVAIGGMGEVITGNTPATSQRDFYGVDCLFVSPADISDSRFVETTKTNLSEVGFAQARPIKARSVLFVCIGSTIGKVAQNARECATNQQINAVVANSDFSGDFIYYLLDMESERIAELAGRQAVPIINKTLFSSVKVLAPRLGEQHRIADCLSSLDTQIATESNQLAALKTHKQGLMQQLFPSPESAAI